MNISYNLNNIIEDLFIIDTYTIKDKNHNVDLIINFENIY